MLALAPCRAPERALTIAADSKCGPHAHEQVEGIAPLSGKLFARSHEPHGDLRRLDLAGVAGVAIAVDEGVVGPALRVRNERMLAGGVGPNMTVWDWPTTSLHLQSTANVMVQFRVMTC